MSRWIILLVISSFVVTGVSGCVLVVADEDVAHDIKVEKNRSRLARNIAADLDRDESLKYSDIRVSEDDGVVTLKGDVDSISSLEYAMDLASRHNGVVSVISHLTVELTRER